MSVEVTAFDGDDGRWDDLVEQSPQGTVFHRSAALAVQADHAGGDLHRLVGYKGEEPVGLLPVVVLGRGPLRAAVSPPPDLRVPYLGPAMVNLGKLKRRKAERRRRRFVEACMDWLDEAVGPRFLHVRTGDRFADPRPFDWQGWDVSLSHTYVVDLAPGREAVRDRFSADARRNVTGDGPPVDVGDVEDVERIVAAVRDRYESQGIDYRVPEPFVTDLYRALSDGAVRPYVCREDGAFLGGVLALADGDTVYRWQGGVRTDAAGDRPVNDCLDWGIMTDAMEEGRGRYDLVGADNERINRYKAKFGPELRRFYGLQRAPPGVGLLAGVYRQLRK